MGNKNIYKAWKLETFQELLKFDKRKAYEYRKEVLGHKIPENYLTDVEKVELSDSIKKIDTPEEIMDAIDDDEFEEEPVEEIKKELKRQDLFKMLKDGGINIKGTESNKKLFTLCEDNKLL